MRKFQKLMLSHRCVCMCADLHLHAYQQQLKWTRNQKKLTGLRKDTIGWTHGCRQTREWWRHCVRESIRISLGGCLCVGVSVCLRGRICANMGCAKWNTCSDSLHTFLTWFRNVVHAATVLTPFWLIPQCRGVHWLSFCVGLLYPAHLPCNAHATHMQHTCNTHATRHATWAFYL